MPSIEVPNGYVIPPVYMSSDLNTVSLALTLGAEAYETLQGTVIKSVRSETHADAIKNFKREYDLKTEEYVKRFRQEKQKAEEACSATEARLEALEQSASAVRSSAQAAARETFEELIKAKDAQIEQLQRTIDAHFGAVTGRIDVLQSSITKSFSSSKDKGTFGESFTETMIKKAFDCDIQSVSRNANTSDILMSRGPEKDYFWEVKNYTRMVTTEEVEKLRRDLRLHPHIRGGCLVSLRTGIVGRARGGDIDIEFLRGGQFILFISNLLAREDIVFYLQTLRPLFDAVELYSKPQKEETEALRNLEMKSSLITNLLRSHAANVAKHRNSISSHKKRSDAMFAEFQSHIMEAESQIHTVLRVTMGSDEDSEEVIKETGTVLPLSVFQKERLSEYDGRAKGFIAWLLENTEEGGALEIKEVIEKAKQPGYGEKFIRDLRDDVFQQIAWNKGGRYISGLRWK